ncbi:beta-galactosidase [Paenibacillus roseipurpureus]|uniref:Beta-galactosidase n=1 Tax=Paenibacillus roseopurpureus TaxID=2918901 RepID=A0AA96RKW7_9BACL|nr:beta-galactosidase [Paenibacillus sp. MBLB1832]WNR46818.1 beta-galactosidase [Paenibacillus sp. MBLB1832]
MPINNKLKKVWYGGDYNPEQWDKRYWDEDVRLFQLAGIDVATVNVFSWPLLQPAEDEYDFSMLDSIMEKLQEGNIGIILGTSTAAHPAWMAARYPDILRVDWEGRKRTYGGRHNSCPNSPTYRNYAAALAEKLAERYGNHPGLLLWHVNNEMGGYCYCDNCAKAFRVWLKKRYGTIETLNKVWYTAFWGHTFYDWNEIVPPNLLSEGVHWNWQRSNQTSISLDYFRFGSDSLLACYKLEVEAIRKHSRNIPITTNFMGTYKEMNYFDWAPYIDVISWDSYPAPNQPPSMNAMTHDLMRGLKDGQPFMLMEQTPSVANWQPYCKLKRPGEMKKWSYQAVAHGADTVMFFQLRKSLGSCEKMHGAVIEHVGHGNTRVFRECAELGEELGRLGDVLIDARPDAQVGILYDWENRWAVELSSGPSNDLNYVKEVHKYYDALYDLHIPVDMVGLNGDFNRYEVIIAPLLYMIKPGFAAKVESFVEAGGTFLTTYFSGIVNETDLAVTGGYPGELRKVLGIWAEEIDALYPEDTNELVMNGAIQELQGTFSCSFLCELIHTETAEVMATYGEDFYAGMPALTVNRYGQGLAYYVATSPEKPFLVKLLEYICKEKGIESLLPFQQQGIEASRRVKDGRNYLFLINHNNTSFVANTGLPSSFELLSGKRVTQNIELPAHGVAILQV